MKTRLRKFSALAAILLASAIAPARAQSGNALRIHIPFAFVAGGHKLPPGDYTIQEIGPSGLLLITGRGADTSAAVLTSAGGPINAGRDPGATFDGRGAERYLSQVQLFGEPTRIVMYTPRR